MPKSKGSVIVVDDKGIVAKDISKKVKDLGYKVLATASSSDDAIEKAQEHNPDLILMDIKLKSKKDGIDTADEIYRRFGIPSIYITAYSDEDTLERAKRTKPYGYIIKPFEEKELEVNLELAFERLKAEKALGEMESKYHTLLEAAQDYIYLIDRNHCISYINPAAARLFNAPQEKVIGASIKKLFSKDTIERQTKNIDKVLKTGEEIFIESPYTIKGKTIWMSARLVPVYDSSGKIVHVLGISRDISDIKKAEIDLAEQHERFSTIMDKHPEYIFVCDPNTHEVLFVNQKVRALIGKDPVGGICYEEFSGKDSPCEYCSTDIILKTKMPHVWEGFNPHLGRHLLNTDQLIQWPDGKEVKFITSIDITDQKKIEKILQVSENKYKSFIEHSSYGFYVLDTKGNVTYLNDRARELTGYDMENGKMKKFSDFISKESYESASIILEELVKGKKINEPRVYNIKHEDGSTKIMEVQTLPIWREDGLAGFHGTLVDITQKSKFQEELKEKTEFLDAIIQNSSDGIFVIDEDFKYVMINPACGEIVGHEPESWIGKRAGTYRHPDDEEASIAAIMEAMNGGLGTCDVRVQSSDGIYKLLSMRYSLMMLGDDVHILGLVTDITEKKKAEEALIASEEKYRSLFEHSPEAIVILDLEGKIVECNNATAGLMEMNLNEIIGKKFDELGILELTQAEAYGKILQMMISGQNIEAGEVELIMNNGHSKWIETFPNAIMQSGNIIGIQMIARDITERKFAELEMRKKLMKFELDHGNVYLSKEPSAAQSLDAFKELLMVGHSGLLISRHSRKEFQGSIDYMFNHVYVSETDKGNSVQPNYKAIHDMFSHLPRGEIVHIDCVEYLVSRIGPKRTLNLIQYVKDIAITKNLIVLLSVDPRAMSEAEMRLIEKESKNILPSISLTRLSPKLLETLEYIDKKNKENILPSYSEIGEYFQLSKPTARARIRQLEELGTVKEIQRGRMKVLELTDKGKNYLIV